MINVTPMKPSNLSMAGFRMSFKQPKLLSYLLLFLIGYCLPVQSQAAYQAHQIEAVYIFRIANFIQWTNKPLESPLTFCGESFDPVVQTLIKISTDKRIQDRNVNIKTSGEDTANQCDIYIANKNTKPSELQAMAENILTISGKKNFTHERGMIELRQVDGKVKPIINLDNLENTSFKISSQLLRISIIEGGNNK
ncbi:YfiR family protein [Aliivibrio finisterrensis]|uniref:YfiR family protein n=2 Tax=Vibrionaceae TaxID=641 RepID=A0A4Q5KWI2_9GAMM|nr:YfiR family protein [Aliivibrio finisterrensis]RYU53343.1 YfiR family protein [Aliivibrio finisterrensis]RYU55434.1 YfiR family protein [Aliivibrio finisterrensis]RYU65850.1 YfiR family protein [Aliivibrio finisterrensis]RYU80357.1 YfiR family protein [Aliivibrio finisterrensis]